MFFRLRKYFAVKRQFSRIIKNAVRIDGKEIKSIHVGHWFGFVVNIGNYLESRWCSKQQSIVFYLKNTNIEVFLNSPKTQEYWIEWKD